MTDNILPDIDFAAVIAEILEDYAPDGLMVHNLTDQQVSDMYNDLVAGCEEAYDIASEETETLIEEALEKGVGIDPFDLPNEPDDDEEAMDEESFRATEVVQEAIAVLKTPL